MSVLERAKGMIFIVEIRRVTFGESTVVFSFEDGSTLGYHIEKVDGDQKVALDPENTDLYGMAAAVSKWTTEIPGLKYINDKPVNAVNFQRLAEGFASKAMTFI